MKDNKNQTPASDSQSIGDRIAKLRKEKGLTQQELADLLYVKRENIAYWENGQRDIKSGQIVQIADALNTSCDYILRGIDTEQLDLAKNFGFDENTVKALKIMYVDADNSDVHTLNYLLSELPALFNNFIDLRLRVRKYYICASTFKYTPSDFFRTSKCLNHGGLRFLRGKLKEDVLDENGFRKDKGNMFHDRLIEEYIQLSDAQDLIKLEEYNLQTKIERIAERFCSGEIKRLNNIAQAEQERIKNAGTTENGEGEADEKP